MLHSVVPDSLPNESRISTVARNILVHTITDGYLICDRISDDQLSFELCPVWTCWGMEVHPGLCTANETWSVEEPIDSWPLSQAIRLQHRRQAGRTFSI